MTRAEQILDIILSKGHETRSTMLVHRNEALAAMREIAWDLWKYKVIFGWDTLSDAHKAFELKKFNEWFDKQMP